MKGIAVFVMFLAICIALQRIVFAQTPQSSRVPYVQGEILVQYQPGAAPADTDPVASKPYSTSNPIAAALHQRALELQQNRAGLESKIGMSAKHLLVAKRNYLMQLHQGSTVSQALTTMQSNNTLVASAQPNYIFHELSTTPNDPYFTLQWALSKIQAPAAWDISTGSASVTVAIVDTGVDYNNPDLPAANIIKGEDFATCNAYDTSGNCISPKTCTQLANGYCDNDPMDDFGHGTHVAGIVGASTNNNLGVSGVNWNVKILAVKVAGSSGQSAESEVAQGIQYAADQGANIINLSLGENLPCSQTATIQQAINYAFGKGVLVVVAAGNGNAQGVGQDASNFSPASCTNVLTIGATDPLDQRAAYSNYGADVQLAAPGGAMQTEGLQAGILSTKAAQCNTTATGMCSNPQLIYNTNYLYANGTSMAAPYVSGVAALLLANNPALTNQQLYTCLTANADPITTDYPIGPRVNAYKSLVACPQSVIPSPSPSPTPAPTDTLLSLQVFLHGIGSSGDSLNPSASSLSNKNPLTPIRQMRVGVYTNQSQQIANVLCPVQYDTVNGDFSDPSSPCDIGQIPTGNYEIKVTTQKYLTKIAANILAVTGGTTNTVPPVTLIAGDINGDNKIDISDYNLLLTCLSDLGQSASCSPSELSADDLNDDGKVDASDYNLFLREMGNQNGQ